MAYDSNFLKELHKENSIFMNRALFGVPAIGVPLIVHTIIGMACYSILTKVCFFLALIFFLISVGILLWSFFISEKAIEELDNANNPNLKEEKKKHLNLSEKALKSVKHINTFAFILVVAGFIAIIIAIYPII